MEDKIKKLLELIEECDSNRTNYSLNISRYAGEWVVAYKKLDWEYYGDTLELTIDKAIQDVEEAIQDREEEEREYLKEREHQERIYWEKQVVTF